MCWTSSWSVLLVRDAADEVTLDLERVERDVLEIEEGGEAGAEVVEREAAADAAQRVGEAPGLVHVADRGGLGDLEHQQRGIDPRLVDQLARAAPASSGSASERAERLTS